MKSTFYFLIGIFAVVHSYNIEEKRTLFVNSIAAFIPENPSLPKNYNLYVIKHSTKMNIIFQGVKVEDVDKVQVRYGLSDEMAAQIKAAKYYDGVSVTTETKLESIVATGHSEYQYSIGAAFKEGDIIYFCLMSAITDLLLRVKYTSVCHEECTTVLWMESCEDVCDPYATGYNANEEKIVVDTVKYYSIQEFNKYLPTLQETGYQAYFSSGTKIYSEDGKYAVYMSYFGDLCVGAKGDLKAVEPVKYYEVITKDNQYKRMPMNLLFTRKYSSTEIYEYNAARIERINFIGQDFQGNKDLHTTLKRMKQRNSSNYYMKILSNGNLVIYKGTDIIWQTNTADQGGVLPFDFNINGTEFNFVDDNRKVLFHADAVPYVTQFKKALNYNANPKTFYSNWAIMDNYVQIDEWKLMAEKVDGTKSLVYCKHIDGFLYVQTSCPKYYTAQISLFGYIYSSKQDGTVALYLCLDNDNEFFLTENQYCIYGDQIGKNPIKLGYAFKY